MTLSKKISLAFAAVVAAQILISVLAFFEVHGAFIWTIRGLYLVGTALVSWLSIRGMNQTLAQSIHEMAGSAEQVSLAAAQISTASHSLAQGTSQQAASLEETSASTEEINSMAQRNSENSHAAAELVKQSDDKFADANRSLQDMISAMAEINASSDKISKIIKVIDEIAFQTNILALNAAVEAARAGEAGMGFAVVADEVRNLAQRSAQAARDTAVLIEESIAKSNDGKLKVDQVSKAIRGITEQSAQIKILVDEVHLGSQEQSRGIDQISKAIAQMEQLTQNAAASAEESASTAEQLKAQSSALKNVVQHLNSTIVQSVDTARSISKPSLAVKSGPKKTRAAMGTSLSALDKAVSKSAKGADAGPEAAMKTAHSSRGVLDDTNVLRGFLKSKPQSSEFAAVGVASEKDPFPMDDNFQEF
jgi:methyl-accepting chemotaxis protein